MNDLQEWLARHRGAGRQELLAALQGEYPRMSSTSLSQYARGKRVPERRKAELIAAFTGVPLEAIPFRMVHRPVAFQGPGRPAEGAGQHEEIMPGPQADGKPKNKPLKGKGFFFFLRRCLAIEG